MVGNGFTYNKEWEKVDEMKDSQVLQQPSTATSPLEACRSTQPRLIIFHVDLLLTIIDW
jgi:hypothetical protein